MEHYALTMLKMLQWEYDESAFPHCRFPDEVKLLHEGHVLSRVCQEENYTEQTYQVMFANVILFVTVYSVERKGKKVQYRIRVNRQTEAPFATILEVPLSTVAA